MSAESTKRMAPPDAAGLAEAGVAAPPDGVDVSPHLRRVRSVWRFLKGPAFLVVAVLIVGAVAVVKISGG